MSLHLLDIAENSISARASRINIFLEENISSNLLVLSIEDNGQGMDKETLKKAVDPFFTSRTTRKVGLGLSLLAEAARAAGGHFSIESSPGRGTKVRATFKTDHWDMKPLGDIPQTLATLIMGHPEVDIVYIHQKDGQEFTFSTEDIRARFNGQPLNSPGVMSFIINNLKEGTDLIRR